MQIHPKSRPLSFQVVTFVWTFLLCFVASMMAVAVVYMLLGATIGDLSKGVVFKNEKTALRIGTLIQFLVLFLTPAVLTARLSGFSAKQYLGMRKPHHELYFILGLLALLLSIPMVEYTGYLNKHIPFGPGISYWMEDLEQKAAKSIQLLLSGSGWGNLALNLVFIAAFAGMGEEILFRGVIQRLAIQATRSPWAGIIIAAFLFSFFHLQFFGFIPRFLLGILLGVIYWYSGSIWPAVVAHFVYDAFIVVVAHFTPALITDPNVSLVAPDYLPLMAVLSAAAVSGLVWAMMRLSKTRYSEMMGEEIPTLNMENDPEAWR